MSIFAVNHLCREVLRDHAFRAAMKAYPDLPADANVEAWLNRMIDRPSIQSLEGLTVQLLAGV